MGNNRWFVLPVATDDRGQRRQPDIAESDQLRRAHALRPEPESGLMADRWSILDRSEVI